MKSMELEPTHENVLKTLKNNILDRNKDVWYFVSLCNEQEGNCTIALDAKWGSGKTFFVKQAKMLMEAMNAISNTLPDNEREEIKSIFSPYARQNNEKRELSPQVCVYYDAWINDNDNDPILSLIFEIVRSSTVDYDFKGDIGYIKALTNLVDVCMGRNVTTFLESLKSKDPLKKLKEQKEIHIMVEEFLNDLLLDRGNRLVIFIDELDRCKPSYAVQLLERIKHYFTNDRITFVFSVNLEELQHTIRHYYGEGFDASRYLNRFFDIRTSLPPTDMTRYYQEIGFQYSSYLYEYTCKVVMDHYLLGMRDIERYYRLVKIAASKPAHDERILKFSDEEGLQLLVCVIVPIMIGLQVVDIHSYNDFVNGKNPTPLLEIIETNKQLTEDFKHSLFTQAELEDNRNITNLDNRLHLLYEAIFMETARSDGRYAKIGKLAVTRRTKEQLMRAVSMLSKYASYE